MLALMGSPACAQAVWEGDTSSEWTEAQNWSGGTLPDSTSTVTIAVGSAASMPVIDGEAVTFDSFWLGSPDGASLTIQGDGVLNTTGGATVSNPSLTYTPGTSELQSGTVTVTGEDAEWNAYVLSIGQYGTGIVNVEDGAKLLATWTATLGGAFVTSTGTVNISGEGTTWETLNGNIIGSAGIGNFNVSDGAVARDFAATIGQNAGSVGTATIKGSGSEWHITGGTLAIGSAGTGTVSVLDGASVSVAGTTLLSGTKGTLEVMGADSKLASTKYIAVGMSGVGQMTVSDGGTVEGPEILVGYQKTGSGSVALDGAESTLAASKYLMIGYQGAGTVTVSNGATIRVTSTSGISIANTGTATGTLNIGAAAGDTAAAAGFLDVPFIVFGAGTGELVFNHTSDDYAFSTLITGTGDVSHVAGHTTLSGANTYTGDTLLSGGTLVLGGDDALGGSTLHTTGGTLGYGDGVTNDNAMVVDGGALQLQVIEGSAVQSGSIDGASGQITKVGDGVLVLTGDGSGFAGTTQVAAGTLVVGVEGNGALGGALDVLSGATLGGTGTVGATTIMAGGVHGPGNSVGTQTIAGDYANHGSLRIEGTPDGLDKLVVLGAVDITGATLDLRLAALDSPDWAVSGPFVIIDNDGTDAVTGTFAPVPSTFVFLDTELDYVAGDGNDVAVSFERNSTSFASLGETRNQRAVAGALDTLDPGHPVWSAVALTTSESEARAAYDQLSGAQNATVRGLLAQESAFIRNTIEDRLRAAFGATGRPDAPPMAYASPGMADASAGHEAIKAALATDDTERLALWSRAFGAVTDIEGDANAAGLTADTGGVTIGGDRLVAAGWRLGVSGGFSHTGLDFDGRDASGSVDSWTVGAYAGNRWRALSLHAGLAYTWHSVESERTVTLAALGDSPSAEYWAGTFQAFGGLGYALDTAVGVIEPFADLAYVRLDTDGFTENGGAAALTVADATMQTGFATLGLRAQTGFDFDSTPATLHGTLGWQHAFGDVVPGATQAFAGSAPFTVAGAPLDRDAALVDAGLDLAITEATTFGLALAGRLGDGVAQGSFNTVLKMRF